MLFAILKNVTKLISEVWSPCYIYIYIYNYMDVFCRMVCGSSLLLPAQHSLHQPSSEADVQVVMTTSSYTKETSKKLPEFFLFF